MFNKHFFKNAHSLGITVLKHCMCKVIQKRFNFEKKKKKRKKKV